ncbi:MAG: Uma2 family endonuclease [Cyanobacteria bacterium J06621_12]
MRNPVKWSVDDYHSMLDSGILNSRSVELIAGEIIEVSPESPLHRYANDSVAEYLRGLLKDKAKVFESHPITLIDSEPEPDISIVSLPNSNYLERHPDPKDIYWLIEISNTTLEDDLNKKKRVYAQAGINEYWIIDLKNIELIVFRETSENDYKTKFISNSGLISSLAFPNIEMNISALLNVR